jgi:hypothetical protein
VDALLIAQFYVGLISGFPCESQEPTGATTSQPTSVPTPEPTQAPTPVPTVVPTTEPGSDAPVFKVQYQCGEASASANQIKPHVNIINTGSVSIPLDEITLRYFYTKEGSASEEFHVDYAIIGSANVTGRFSSGYLEAGFTTGAGNLSAGASTGEIQLRINKSDWSNCDQSNDWSFDSTKSAYEDWERITLYRNGEMIWGIDADGNTPGPTSVPTPTPEPTPVPPPQTYYVDSCGRYSLLQQCPYVDSFDR